MFSSNDHSLEGIRPDRSLLKQREREVLRIHCSGDTLRLQTFFPRLFLLSLSFDGGFFVEASALEFF